MMPHKPIQTVIFDIGNVLVTWDPRFLYEKLISDPKTLDYFLSEIVTLEWHTAHDAGLPMVEGARRLSAAYPRYTRLIDDFRHRWFETLGPVIEGSVEVLKILHEKEVPLYALTNFSAETFPEFARRYSFIRYFKDVLVSAEVGIVKPDPRIYKLATQRFNITPQNTLFIDDRIANIEAAQAQGYQTHHFKDASQLTQCLKGKGLL